MGENLNERHEMSDVSSTALHRRIAELERRIATLEANMGQGQVGHKAQTTITPWRVLNSVLVLGLGGYKAAATYLGQTTGPTTTDWIVGVVWTLMCVAYH